MTNDRKGIEIQGRIIQEARAVFNHLGFQLTLGELAIQIGISKGGITNYFKLSECLQAQQLK